MIIDKIQNIILYKGLQTRLDDAFDYIKNNDLFHLKAGRHSIDGDNIFLLMNEYETKLEKANALEAHRKYIDVQYILEGEELIEYASFNNQEISREYDSENDYAFYHAENTIKLDFQAGMFAVFFPDDLHMPGVKCKEVSAIRKIVLKVLI